MPDVLIDTDVLVDHLRGEARLAVPASVGFYSAITRAELFAGPEDQEDAVRALLAPFRELPVTSELAEGAGRLRRTTGILLPDALIAATAVANGLELLTRNVRDFSRVPGLTLAAPSGSP